MAITQLDIAKKLGVSQRLVSYALNGHPCVGGEMRERIISEAEASGYRPHRAAQALATGRTYQIALCFPFLGSSFYNEVIRQFEKLTRDTPYDILVFTYNPAVGRGKDPNFTSDGMIFVGAGYHVPRSWGPSVVVIQNQLRKPPTEQQERLDCVQIQIEQAAFAAMRHLREQGYSRIAYVAPSDMMCSDELRFYAYQTVMKEYRLAPELIALPISDEEWLRRQSYPFLKDYFLTKGCPDAIFCCNDDLGIGAYRALNDLGRRIPQETAVIGFDDNDDVQFLNPPMTSVHMPIDEVCQRAWEMLLRRIEDRDLPPQHEHFAAQLIIRDSSHQSA